MEPPRATFRTLESREDRSSMGDRPAPGARLPRLVDVAVDVLAVLSRLVLTIIGVGSVGSRVALEASRLGIRGLRLVDPGTLKKESTLTYPVTLEDVGRSKVEYAGERCLAIAPDLRVDVYEGRVEELDPVDFLDTDLFVVAPDLLAPEVTAGQLALHLRRPLVRAALHGNTLVAQVRSFDGTEDGACPACNFSDEEWEELHRQTRYSCDGVTEGLDVLHPAGIVTRSLAPLCSIASSLAVVEGLRRLLGIGPPHGAVAVEYCGYTHRTTETPLVRRSDCPCEHRRLERVTAPVGSEGASLGALLEAAAMDPGRLEQVTARVDRLRFVESALGGCPGGCVVQSFVPAGAELGVCPDCGASRAENPLATHREVPGEVLAPFLDRSLASLGAAGARSLTLRGLERSVLVTAPTLQTPSPIR